ncbi:hypothetical protein POSPLADRAFT_1156966 [Postia placenta MAD-698-R-SB12]|uniref:Uncharacterized protein n=1 Tax=Postia placenta MAD-698-R-SB12 TaxID=670580 RepID=A0A1X6MMN0_9APHY|nr:hypothetical protein POSPLADRAFT_1156966 [Postia placenta MAD-698-R-SB12]OSX57442.1 hypothetical protein POSPLADRAFT_1156966 [Postia placenta MAD-698-R-SB12]
MQASYDELRDVAAKAVSIFASANLSCCLMGSLACKLYGTTRAPNDVDLIVLTSAHAQEPLKRMLAAADRNFTLVASKARFATYKVVWYRLPPRDGASARRCKVDILVPGTLNIPHVPAAHVATVRGLPVVPLAVLLLLKLQGWTDHRAARRVDMVVKQHDDVRDIDDLLAIARRSGVDVRRESLPWVPSTFLDAGDLRIAQYTRIHPASAVQWQELGAQVPA